MDSVPKYEFRKIVDRDKGNYHVQKFKFWTQFLCQCFRQLTFNESLRNLTARLNTLDQQHYHIDIRTNMVLNTLSRTNYNRLLWINYELAMVLVKQAFCHHKKDLDLDAIGESIYTLDSTTIDLYLSLFPLTKFRDRKTAFKLYTPMVVEGSIPTFIYTSVGRTYIVIILDLIPNDIVSIYIMDLAYINLQRLCNLHQVGGGLFVWIKINLKFNRKSSTPTDRITGLQCVQINRLTGYQSKQFYPNDLHHVHFIDSEKDQDIPLLNNITDCNAEQIADYYKIRLFRRFGKLFLKWIKQNLQIKLFYRQSINTVKKTQIWIVICTYLIMIISHRTNQLNISLHMIPQDLSVAILERMKIEIYFPKVHQRY